MIQISNQDFEAAFRYFEEAVASHKRSLGPFQDFRTGLAEEWESYKVWLHHEARGRLKAGDWKPGWAGSGKILDHVLAAIRIKEDKERRNNIVEWEPKRGDKSTSIVRLLEARKQPSLRQEAENLLFRLFREAGDPEPVFNELTEAFGRRYDLISYLFFLRDWHQFMPVRSSIFPNAFEKLGVPHQMSMRCGWENYQGFLERLHEVRRHLERVVPDRIRLIDAHSFCWMLATLPAPGPSKRPKPVFVELLPEAADHHGGHDGDKPPLSQAQLDELLSARRRIGMKAERIVLDAERERLRDAGRPDLADQVRSVSDNTALGYDIDSFHLDGRSKPIEVKACSRSGGSIGFFLSINELRVSRRRGGYTFALVTEIDETSPTVMEFAGSELPKGALLPIEYAVRLKG